MTDIGLLAIGIGIVVSGIIGGAVGSTRGRAGDGAGLGVLLGPLGWCLALFLPAPIAPPVPRSPWRIGIVGWTFVLLLALVGVLWVASLAGAGSAPDAPLPPIRRAPLHQPARPHRQRLEASIAERTRLAALAEKKRIVADAAYRVKCQPWLDIPGKQIPQRCEDLVGRSGYFAVRDRSRYRSPRTTRGTACI